jgi:hypothetical protein
MAKMIFVNLPVSDLALDRLLSGDRRRKEPAILR